MARLPKPGADSGTWDDILNDYLSQAHKADGTLQDNAVTANVLAPNSVSNAAIASNAVTATSIADGSITEALLDSAVTTKLNQATPTWSTIGGKPAVIASGGDAATARAAIDSPSTSEALRSDVYGANIMGIRTKASPTYGTGYVFGTASSFGFNGTGSPAEIAGTFGIYQEYGKTSYNTNITKTTQGGYVVTNYWGPTVDDSAEAFSSAVLLKNTGTGFTQAKPVTAFEAQVQVEGSNTVSAVGGYALGVGSRIEAVGSSTIDKAYGFKASLNTQASSTGTVGWYAAFGQPATAPGATTKYGVYTVDPINSETSLLLGKSAWSASFKAALTGTGDSVNSMVSITGPTNAEVAGGLTLLRVNAGSGQTKQLTQWYDTGGTNRLSVTSAGALVTTGQQIVANTSGGVNTVVINGSSGYLQIGSTAGLGSHMYSGSGAPTLTGTSGDYYFRTDTPATANQRIYVCTGGASWTGIL